MAPNVEKRLRYFNGQFLKEKDFTDEQAYHIDRQRRHNRLLHTPGIAEGLDVTAGLRDGDAKVAPGTAVDAKGRFIVLAQERPVEFKKQHFGQTVLLVISYSKKEADPATDGGSGNTRWHERPCVEVVSEDEAPSSDTHIRLARLVISKKGTVSSEPDTSVQRGAGVRLGGEVEVRQLTLSRKGVASKHWPALSCSAANQVDLTGALTVTGNVGIGTTEPKSPLSVSGGAVIGADYAAKTAPANGLIVQGQVGIGTDLPQDDSLTINAALSARPRVIFQQGGENKWDIGVRADTGNLFFGDFTDYRMTLDRNGNVGIGNDSPDHLLVVGPASGGRHLVVNDIPTARWGFATGNYNLAIQNDGSGSWETQILLTKQGDLIVRGSILGNTPLDKALRPTECAPGEESASERAKKLLLDKPDGTFMIGGPTRNYPDHIVFYWKAGGKYYFGWIGGVQRNVEEIK